jgi:hypothetical protein
MFDATPDDIAALNDTDLRELVARLCEADLAAAGRTTVGVTWGGSQTAPDGGLDVRVFQEAGSATGGFIPRASTGFQVKLPDMPAAEILAEMQPKGVIRPVIVQLAAEGGSYVIVSSTGSVADFALRKRLDAMRDAVELVPDADKLHVDFYDRTRLATWVRRHPGLIAWVKERINKRADGWHAYGAWSYPAEGVKAEYLSDDKLRLNFGRQDDGAGRSIGSAMDDLRDLLREERNVVRLVGLSGVGKTRLVQALFDSRFGAKPLPEALAVYTNMSDDPDPQPVGMASELIAGGHRAVLIVDNCPPELHRRLTDTCRVPESKLSVLSVEYDVRDDRPESTRVVSLETSSIALIAQIVRRRFPYISQVDAATIAESSGGNARIAIALANTVGESETISGLSDDELFKRLFQQRHDASESLLRAARVCSLLYSFEGTAIEGADSELPILASLARQDTLELYEHVDELLKRELAQERGPWRAILPHAIANRLARAALDSLPLAVIEAKLVTAGTRRTHRSFSRRLSFLHDHPRAVEVAIKWLAEGGLLTNIAGLDTDGIAILGNVAPIVPTQVLTALERTGDSNPEEGLVVWRRERTLLRSLAYEPTLFDRSAWLMARSCTDEPAERSRKDGAEAFLALFTIYLSGTHATIYQRLAIVERLLRSTNPKQQTLGLQAIEKLIKTTHFSSGYKFEFGAHSRDYGYAPRTNEDIRAWFGAALAFIERLIFADVILVSELKAAIGKHLRMLWIFGRVSIEVDALARRIAGAGFWAEGWLATKFTLSLGKPELPKEELERLEALEVHLRPVSLIEKIQALVLGDASGDFALDEEFESSMGGVNRRDAQARALGEELANDEDALNQLLPSILKGGQRTWMLGQGLAKTKGDRTLIWNRFRTTLETLPANERNPQAMCGFLVETGTLARPLAEQFLDAAVTDSTLGSFLPYLQSVFGLDTSGLARLQRGLEAGRIPIPTFKTLMYGGATRNVPAGDLSHLLMSLAERPDGCRIALEILDMRLYADEGAKQCHDESLLAVGRHLLSLSQFGPAKNENTYGMARIIEKCLVGADGVTRLRDAVVRSKIYAFEQTELITELLKAQPYPVLDAIFAGSPSANRGDRMLVGSLTSHSVNPLNAVSADDLTSWCKSNSATRFSEIAECIDLTAASLDEGGRLRWSEQAKTLLIACPDAESVLQTFIARFRPSSWSGSKAAQMESNVRLLDDVPISLAEALSGFIAEARAKLMIEVEEERQSETRFGRANDERFE